MPLYRNVYLLPRFLRPLPKPAEQFHSAACHLVRLEPFRAAPAEGGTVGQPSAAGGAPLQPLTQVHAFDVVTKLNASEREALRQALSRFESETVTSKLEGELASGRWQANSTMLLANLYVPDGKKHSATVSAADDATSPTDIAEDQANRDRTSGEASAAADATPSRQDLMKLMVVNSVPFVGFGFLDNFLMIIAGDYIESTLGVYMCISTMAAAALGNTISDVMGLGLAHHVETLCLFLGMRPPKLTAQQIDGKACRRVMSYGRALGITIGCILGMVPLYFMNKQPKVQAGAASADKTAAAAAATTDNATKVA